MHATAQVNPNDAGREPVVSLLRRAYAGESFVLDREVHSLHDLTQVAVALAPHADLVIRRSELMSPMERSAITTVGRGRVIFR